MKKYMVLGVAMSWGVRKGLDVFVELSKLLPDEYQIVLVGTDGRMEELLPANVITVRSTSSQMELAELYSSADVFVNPTREDNFPTTNIEALACGTPVISFKIGGSVEMLDITSGKAVMCGNVDVLKREIIRTCVEKPFSREACVRRARAFDMNHKFNEYVELFESLKGGNEIMNTSLTAKN